MNIKEQIRAEIERRMKIYGNPYGAGSLYDIRKKHALAGLLDFLDSLPEQPVEETPEPYTGVYDEAYLQEKIAKATKSWEGVDVDKMLAECRGYEQPVGGLEEEVKRYYADNFDYISSEQPTLSILTNIARHFAEWQRKQDQSLIEAAFSGKCFGYKIIVMKDEK